MTLSEICSVSISTRVFVPRMKDGLFLGNKILVSKEIVVLRRWESETKIGFIKQVDKGDVKANVLSVSPSLD